MAEEYRTTTGRVLSDEEIQRLVAEAEQGYPVHKAAPISEDDPHCKYCGQRTKRVRGGQGTTWIHVDSGAVAAPTPALWAAARAVDEAWTELVEKDDLDGMAAAIGRLRKVLGTYETDQT